MPSKIVHTFNASRVSDFVAALRAMDVTALARQVFGDDYGSEEYEVLARYVEDELRAKGDGTGYPG